MSDLAVKNKELLALYQENLEVGTEDAGEGGKLPQLKITHPMALTKDKDAYLLADGGRADMGMIYHTELKEQFEQVAANITYIGQFDLPSYEDPNKTKMTYVAGGVLKADNSPFLVFVKGLSLNPLWDFMSEVSSIRNRFKVPMFALTIELVVGKRPSEKYGEVDVWNFKIKRSKNGKPEIETDQGRAVFLRDTIETFREKIPQIVNEEATNEPVTEMNNRDIEAEQVEEAMK